MKQEKGYTLSELLIVLVLLFVLGALETGMIVFVLKILHNL